jgi:hypothetical protein
MHSDRTMSLLIQYLQAAKRQADLIRQGAQVPALASANRSANAQSNSAIPYYRQRLARLSG